MRCRRIRTKMDGRRLSTAENMTIVSPERGYRRQPRSTTPTVGPCKPVNRSPPEYREVVTTRLNRPASGALTEEVNLRNRYQASYYGVNSPGKCRRETVGIRSSTNLTSTRFLSPECCWARGSQGEVVTETAISIAPLGEWTYPKMSCRIAPRS
jgi:hypothetical protein